MRSRFGKGIAVGWWSTSPGSPADLVWWEGPREAGLGDIPDRTWPPSKPDGWELRTQRAAYGEVTSMAPAAAMLGSTMRVICSNSSVIALSERRYQLAISEAVIM
jgi:hypothetical protein